LYFLAGLATLGAAPIQWTAASGGNGHYYELVVASDFVAWNESAAFAQTAGGYLATITSAEENAFLTVVTGGVEAYIGLTDEALEGTFAWVTGEAFGFSNWAFGEPNNDVAPASPLGEDYSIINPPANPPGTWNDLPDQPLRVTAYVVEYDTAPVPEPSASALFASGVALAFAARRLRRRRSPR
jgi:hypothetical protein